MNGANRNKKDRKKREIETGGKNKENRAKNMKREAERVRERCSYIL